MNQSKSSRQSFLKVTGLLTSFTIIALIISFNLPLIQSSSLPVDGQSTQKKETVVLEEPCSKKEKHSPFVLDRLINNTLPGLKQISKFITMS